jgi:hypothetical protein
MKKLLFISLFVSVFSFGQETQIDTTKHWTRKGTFTFLANQSSFSNWLAGGQNNFAGNFNVNYDFNYKNGHWNWDNKLIVGYGLSKIKGTDTQKTDDKFAFNSLLGRRIDGSNWFFSAIFSFKTQMDTGLDPETQTVELSHFFSPAYFQLGPGMLWKKSDDLKVNIAPATTKMIVVHDHFTEFGPSFGVEQGETTRFELGASVSGYYKFKIMENVTIENMANLYSNYLEDPQNIDLDYQLNIVMKINKYLTTNFAFQTIYDDNAFRGFQTRQTLGVGVNFGF